MVHGKDRQQDWSSGAVKGALRSASRTWRRAPAQEHFPSVAPGAWGAFAGVVVLTLCGTPGFASAFCRTRTCGESCTFDENGCAIEGEPIAWTNRCSSYSVHADSVPSISREELVHAADAAFLTWQETTCPSTHAPPSIAIYDFFGAVACRRVEYNGLQPNANIIVLRGTWHEGADKVLALTTVTYDTTTGGIYDADMEINASMPITAGPLGQASFDLQSILTHEVGHFLGLDHSNKGQAEDCRGGATMCPTYHPGIEDFRTLDEDDINAICTVYPPERKAPACDPAPPRGFSAECGMDPVSGKGCSLSALSRPRSNPATIAITIGCGLVARRRRAGGRVQNCT
jgi:hypothetical protein